MKKVIATKRAPKAVGPYSQAVMVSNLLFISGQIPLDPQTQDIVPGGIKEQTKRVMENIKAILEEVNASLRDIVKTTVFLVDEADFAGMNEIYAQYFKDDPPARSTVIAKGLPRGAKIEIEAVAIISS